MFLLDFLQTEKAVQFTDITRVLCVPTGREFSAEQFTLAYSAPAVLTITANLSAKEQSSIEAIYEIKTADQLKIFLPGPVALPASFSVRLVVNILVSMLNGKINAVRFNWDHASLQQQLGITLAAPNALSVAERVLHFHMMPYTPVSHVNEAAAPTNVLASAKKFNSTSSISSILSGEPDNLSVRPSTKVHAAPGGASHNIFSDEAPPIRTGRKQYAVSSSTESIVGGLAGINLDSRPTTARPTRDPNYTSMSEESHTITGRKLWGGKTNESHFSFGGSFPEEEPKTSRRKTANQEPQAPEVFRPSSRVLNNPGGRSNFVLG